MNVRLPSIINEYLSNVTVCGVVSADATADLTTVALATTQATAATIAATRRRNLLAMLGPLAC